ncbi:hypothetical protein LSCM4_05885 [Leishmania orientalis]|uniref:Uncharacterized protein n=1 Tax=Leishmania orientalis TaxID=2249476 RepID=A0A836GDB0_9TRYP|nr:hypothetical protein LSCM4_05885 [Leishmania orientalis]
MERTRRCRHCTYTINFCPFCGTALAGKHDSATKCHNSGVGGGSVSGTSLTPLHAAAYCAEGSTVAAPWCQRPSAWRERLPRRPVSAYEVYLAAVHGFVADEDDNDGAGAAGAPEAPPKVASAEGGYLNDQQIRAAALSWLRLMPAEKRVYEEEAQSWQAQQERVSTEPTANTAAATAGHSSAAVLPSARQLEEGSSSGAAVLCALHSAEQPLPEQSAPRLATQVPSNKATSARRACSSKTSFILFRADMKGRRKMSIREVAAVWRGMSAEEKAPYDAAAACQRTGQFLSRVPSAPNAQSQVAHGGSVQRKRKDAGRSRQG